MDLEPEEGVKEDGNRDEELQGSASVGLTVLMPPCVLQKGMCWEATYT